MDYVALTCAIEQHAFNYTFDETYDEYVIVYDELNRNKVIDMMMKMHCTEGTEENKIKYAVRCSIETLVH